MTPPPTPHPPQRYNAAKGGVNNLTRSMALALAPHGIRVNAIGPGSIRTDVLASVVADKAAMDKVGPQGMAEGGGETVGRGGGRAAAMIAAALPREGQKGGGEPP
jgi:NAD(P)-dependent dehydrogenase (short-subunit alcohol dehydrogenase family)